MVYLNLELNSIPFIAKENCRTSSIDAEGVSGTAALINAEIGSTANTDVGDAGEVKMAENSIALQQYLSRCYLTTRFYQNC